MALIDYYRRTITATILALTIFATACSQEPSTVIIEGDNAWQEYAACIEAISAEAVLDLTEVDDFDLSAADIDRLSFLIRAVSVTRCAELRPALTTDE